METAIVSVTMRRKPVRREEVRFSGTHILTVPADSVRPNKYRSVEPIERLWVPLVRSLNDGQKQQWEASLGVRKTLAASGWRGGFPAPKPITAPHVHSWETHVYTCEQCGRQFYRTYIARGTNALCSDVCIKRARSASLSKATSERRAAARADRKCVTCGKPIKAQRSTKHFCSSDCRVAAHRSKAKAKPVK